MHGVDKRRELLDGLMGRGIESRRWAIQSLDGKAKAILTAGMIVLGIAMGGVGAIAGSTGGEAAQVWRLLAGFPPLVAFAAVGSLVAILLSVAFAVLALRVAKVRGFGNTVTFMGEEVDRADRGRIRDWIDATDEEVYEKVYDARLRELKSLQEQGRWMGRCVKCSQASLLVGIALGAAWAIMLGAA